MEKDENYEEYQENEEEINTSTTACPYKKAVGFFQNMFGKKENRRLIQPAVPLASRGAKKASPFGKGRWLEESEGIDLILLSQTA